VLNAPRDIGRRNGEFFSYPGVANMTGAPSISLPLAWSSTGLPMGMMFTAGYANEAVLFRLAAQLEKEAPWKGRRPPATLAGQPGRRALELASYRVSRACPPSILKMKVSKASPRSNTAE
jgi:hypothetical protein